jgi:glycosyltransferase involved in cell wall biosynthesis
MTAETPLISVVIPCFNTERYLGEAIESVRAQKAASLEIIVIDDGSTDCSADIARSFGEPVICKAIPHGGISPARNTGIALAQGKYLAFLDADDIWTAGSLDLRLAVLGDGAECVFGSVENFISPELSAEEKLRFGSVAPVMIGRLAGTMLIERKAFDRVGNFDVSLKIGEMVDWVARAEDAGIRPSFVPDVVLRRRVHGSNSVLHLKNWQSDYLRAARASLLRRRGAEKQPKGAA